jgi:hypothetical protein
MSHILSDFDVHGSVHLGKRYVQLKVQIDVLLCILYSSLVLAYMLRVLFAPIIRSTTVAYGHRLVYLWKAEVIIVLIGVEVYFA